MGEVKVKNHISTSYQLVFLSFLVNQPSHSWAIAIPKHDLENSRSVSWVCQCSRSHRVSNILSTHIPFISCQLALPFLRYSFLKIWPWKVKVKVICSWVQHRIDSHPFLPSQSALPFQHPIHSHPFVSCQLTLPFMRHKYFKMWPWKSKVIMGEV